MKRAVLATLMFAAAAAPATASAATIEITDSDGTEVIAYKAERGELNAVQMSGTVNGGLDFRMEFFEYAASLTAGAGCVAGFPVICGEVDDAFPVDVSLLDQKDIASVNSHTEDLTLDAGSGNDDVFAGGIDANADGGSGNDTIRIAANNVTTGTGGSGRDRLAAGLGAAAATLDGGTGDDLLVPGGFMFSSATGGTGGDRLVNFTGDDVTLSGQTGDDVLVAAADGTVELNAGTGDDVAAGQVGGLSVSAGSGDDVIDVYGAASTAADTVSCGPGWDLVWANGADVLAADCETELNFNPPALPAVTKALAAAETLLAHMPDPSQP